jgi:hypothetical protein
MDMRKFSAGVVRPEDLDEPRLEKIVNVYENEKHKCAVLVFESGDELFLWNNLARVLAKAWGWNSEDYIDQEVEISRGTWLDKRDNPPTEKDCINIRAVSPAKAEAGNVAPRAAQWRMRSPSDETTCLYCVLTRSSTWSSCARRIGRGTSASAIAYRPAAARRSSSSRLSGVHASAAHVLRSWCTGSSSSIKLRAP